DIEMNWQRAADLVEAAARQGAQIVVFPECYLQGYRADERFAETAVPLIGPFADRVVSTARRLGVWIILGLARADTGFPHLVYNSAALFGPTALSGATTKFISARSSSTVRACTSPGAGTYRYLTAICAKGDPECS